MLVPLSWLKEYVDIGLKPKELGDKLTEVGLGCEKIVEQNDDVLFELEITPNRPDCLSLLGIAREIAAIEQKSVHYPKLKTDLKPQTKELPLTIKTDSKINPRFTGIIIQNIKVGKSPEWLKKRLEQIGQRSINNIVDITNYVMGELGNPIHAFDYDKIVNHKMIVHQSKGGEQFKSVDGISYRLPKGAVVISDGEKIIDLCGIKGGYNSGTFEDTKTIFIRVPVEIPNLIRRASQSLGLRSEASSIFERGVNAGGTVDALKRTVDLIQEYAGGEIASKLYDEKAEPFGPWKLSVRIKRLNKLLGIEIPEKEVVRILTNLNLSPHVGKEVIECTIPTYRNDLKIEEDLIEEVARLYGYNKFPKTIPQGVIRVLPIPYFKDYKLDEKIKNVFKSAGFSEVYSYSLMSEQELLEFGIAPDQILRLDNPVSREFEYLRPTLRPNITKAFRQNKAVSQKISLFELGKVFLGKTIDKTEEVSTLSGITNEKSYLEVKGIIQHLFKEVGSEAKYAIDVVREGVLFEINISELLSKKAQPKLFKPLPKYPPIVEDLAFMVDENAKIGLLIESIKNQSSLIADVELLDRYKNTVTFHVVYQSKDRNLTTDEIKEVREKLAKHLLEKFNAKLKE